MFCFNFKIFLIKLNNLISEYDKIMIEFISELKFMIIIINEI